MKASELHNLLEQNKEKLPLIDEIMAFHPGMGTQLGWSWYVGGMKDSGEWKMEVLLQVPYNTLLVTLGKWTKEAAEVKAERKEEDAKRQRYKDEGRLEEYYTEMAEREKQARQNLKNKIENQLIWGKHE